MPDRDPLERSLGEPGPRERGYRPQPMPATLDEALRGRRGASIIPRAGVLVGVAALAAVATLAVVSRLPGENRAGGPTVTASARASETAAPAAPCVATVLAFSPDAWGGAAGSRGTSILFRTVDSAAACTVSGAPSASIVDASGQVLVVAPAVSGSPVELGPGKVAELTFRWSNWCGAAPAQPLTLVLDLGAAPIRIPVTSQDGTPPCLGPAEPSAFTVLPFAPSMQAFPEG